MEMCDNEQMHANDLVDEWRTCAPHLSSYKVSNYICGSQLHHVQILREKRDRKRYITGPTATLMKNCEKISWFQHRKAFTLEIREWIYTTSFTQDKSQTK